MEQSTDPSMQRRAGRQLNRRQFVGGGVKAGVSITALGSFLSACAASGGSAGGGGEGEGGGAPISIAIGESPWLRSFQEVAKAYEKETGNRVNLRVFTFEGLLAKQLNAVNVKSPEFDIFTVNEGWAADFYDAGFVVPLADVAPDFELEDGIIEYEGITRWDKEQRYFSEDGPVYGLPINGNIQLFFYRGDLYDKLGLEPPETFDDVKSAARKIQSEDRDVYGYALRGEGAGYAVTYDFLPYLRGFGGDIFADPPSDWTVTLNDGPGLEAAELFIEMAAFGPSEPQNVGQATLIALMQSGRLGQTTLASAAFALVDDEAESKVGGKVRYSLVPKPDADGVFAPTSGIWLQSIPAHIEEPKKKAAIQFIKWLMAKDNQLDYAKASGVVTRQDVYESDLAKQDKFRYMEATAASTQYVKKGADYPFSAELLQVTERGLEAMVGGRTKPKQALDRMAADIESVVKDAGFA